MRSRSERRDHGLAGGNEDRAVGEVTDRRHAARALGRCQRTRRPRRALSVDPVALEVPRRIEHGTPIRSLVPDGYPSAGERSDLQDRPELARTIAAAAAPPVECPLRPEYADILRLPIRDRDAAVCEPGRIDNAAEQIFVGTLLLADREQWALGQGPGRQLLQHGGRHVDDRDARGIVLRYPAAG